ncbi:MULTISPECIES: DUF2079 domain-containing protein [unclassified Synechococcus]|uniref:DUF2079 domain-containing protein n=1 Tax=unclassified Synechococcus TaxID=2626047 RepID=UPI002AD38C9B|nr:MULTISPECIES: DUF2079 domain-containing protein [unclassified Synechococcus]MEA5424644.1 DUF2079 domain-containing protein [Synechococcus sp. CCY9202]CAK6689733.1 hypothetical protein IFHNHDMJ_00667 [Synechococcus sp. CBW1107]
MHTHEPASLEGGTASHTPNRTQRQKTAARRVWIAAAIFAAVGLLLQWWRLSVLTASYDQGIFLQVLANGWRGHPFESTLSSQLSTNVVHGGELPALGYHRLGQHFTPILALWIPLVRLLGIWALPLIQVGLVTAAGLVLHHLARRRLEPALAAWVALSFFVANAVIGPTWGNFTDLCQLPLVFFVLILGLERRCIWQIALGGLAMPLIREDTGVLLVGVALWLVVRERQRWPLALALAAYGGGWVVLVTNVLMPLFSEDNSRRFMVENFGQYLGERDQASSLEVLFLVLRQPLILLRELVSPPGETLRYLAAQGLPLAFVPLISLDSWLMMGLPLLGLLLAQGTNNPLSINIRYTFLVVPGLFSGAVFWWSRHGALFRSRYLKAIWAAAMLLSLMFALSGNPNRSLSFIIPDSIDPWVYQAPWRQWEHGRAARLVLSAIPAKASVAANTPLVPLLADREVVVRFPHDQAYQDRQGQERPVDWIAVDVDWLQRYAVAFPGDRQQYRKVRKRLLQLVHKRTYGIQAIEDGVVVLKRGSASLEVDHQRLKQLLSSGLD